jgi:putative CocE/NonD family hydrolase
MVHVSLLSINAEMGKMAKRRRPRTVKHASVAAALGCLSLVALALTPAASAVIPSPVPGAPAVESAPLSLTGLSPSLPSGILKHSAMASSKWKPENAIYGTASVNDIPISGSGGTIIRVNEIYPTLASGRPAPGKFPIVMTMTPYGKGQGGSSKPGSAQNPGGGAVTGGALNYLVERGYINIVEDVRGTGDSNGSWGIFDPIQSQDAIKVMNWGAHLPHSDGRIGTYGPSYLGIDQLLLAGAVGKNSPLKAIFPMVPANDIYRDTSFMGGLVDAEFDEAYYGLETGLNTATPVEDALTDTQVLDDLVGISLDHGDGLLETQAAQEANILGNGDQNYDGSYWQARAPESFLKKIVANRIPAYIVGGEFDIFQNGEPLNYAELQNAWAGRSVNAPMLPNQKTTGRYQMLIGPWEHLNGSSVDVDELELEWFDTWLKHENTGMGRTPTPIHYYNLGTGNFDETAHYPFTHSTPTKYYFGAGDSLTSTVPRATKASDSIIWSPTGVPCTREVDQWSMGGITIPTNEIGVLAPCVTNTAASQLGPWTISYTSSRLTSARTIAGPVAATVYASANTLNTELVAELEEVTPDGTSYPITEGALLGSSRAMNQSKSWIQDGTDVYPYHPFTMGSVEPVTPGKVTEYQIQIFPTLITVPKGDRIRLTISTSDVPHLTPIPSALVQMVGGVYSIQRTASAPSSLTLDLIK